MMALESCSLLCLDTPTNYCGLFFYLANKEERGIRDSLNRVISIKDNAGIPRFNDIKLEIILAPTTLIYFNTETENTND